MEPSKAQPVVFHFTNKSCDGKKYFPVVNEIIKMTENIGLRVIGVVSDMGGANQGLWRLFGICEVSRFSTVRNKCPNPSNNIPQLYFFHDPAQSWKNLKDGALNHNFIKISYPFKMILNCCWYRV